ncbi:MAG: 2-polyprenylphenol 6-hydroxylase [Pseudomonadota bacterium]
MASAILNMTRLARAGFVFARYGVRLLPQGLALPLPVKIFRYLTSPLRLFSSSDARHNRIARALARLGPSYIKLGQFLATRDDLIGSENARDLAMLRDKLPPFSYQDAESIIKTELGADVDTLFKDFGPPIAAASVAQVHKACVEDNGITRDVAVKILRPNIEVHFHKNLESYFFAAKMIEFLHRPSRRLKPLSVVQTLAYSVELELDLRMEASAISEMRENTINDPKFRIPKVDWTKSSKHVLTTEFIDGIPLSDVEAIKKAGHDLQALARLIIQSFLRHAMRDGFFHADMHQGNLFVDKYGNLVAIDFGIMGRLGLKERRFLAEILYGFITKNYTRVAEVHFEAGYVPPHKKVEDFAQALRAIGEPLMDRTADEISMAKLLGQLLQVTEIFDMETRPELIMLQKTMVVVEGVARTLDPHLNMWTIADPVVREWVKSHFGAEGRLQEAADGAVTIGKFMGDIPGLLSRAESTAQSLSDMAASGLRLDEETIKKIAQEQAHFSRNARLGIWVGALSLLAIAIQMMF